jgi:hypothetical protein
VAGRAIHEEEDCVLSLSGKVRGFRRQRIYGRGRGFGVAREEIDQSKAAEAAAKIEQ